MPSVHRYFKETDTAPVPLSFFEDPIITSLGLHVRPMTTNQKYRECKLQFPCPVQVFHRLTSTLPEHHKTGVRRLTLYDRSKGDIKQTSETNTQRRWKLKFKPGHASAVDELFRLERARPHQALGAARLVQLKGKAKRKSLPRKMAMAVGPVTIKYQLHKVRVRSLYDELTGHLFFYARRARTSQDCTSCAHLLTPYG